MPIPRLRSESSELHRVVWSLATLSAVGFSVVLTLQLWWLQLPLRSNFALSNTLGTPGRNVLLITLGAGLLLPALVGLFVLQRKREHGLNTLRLWATLLSPLSVAFVLPGLFLSQLAEAKPLFYLIVLSAFGLALRALLTASLRVAPEVTPPRAWHWLCTRPVVTRFSNWHLSPWLALLVVVVAATAYTFFLGRYAVAHHRLIQTVDSDVGIADNVMSNLARGLFRAPAEFGTRPGNPLTAHADYIALLFAPLYRLHPSAESLLWLQPALVALSAIPLFLLASRLVGQRVALWVSFGFLLLAPLHGAVLYNFSWQPALCLFSFLLYYAVVAERGWLIALALPAALASTEAGPPAVFALGAFLGASQKRTKLALSLCLLSALAFVVNTALAMRVTGNAPVLPTIAQGAKTLFTNPVYFVLDLARAAKITSVLHALAPLLLIPLGKLASLPLLVPGFLQTSASSEFWPGARAAYPFALLWIPGGLLSVLFALQRLRLSVEGRPRFVASIVALSIVLLSHSYDFGALLRGEGFGGSGGIAQFHFAPGDVQRYSDLKSVVKQLPPSAGVVATTFMLPHVSNRPDAFDARRPFGRPEYVFLSSLELVSTSRESLSDLFAEHRYRLVAQRGEFYLFRRSAETPETNEALRKLGLLRTPPAESPAALDAPTTQPSGNTPKKLHGPKK